MLDVEVINNRRFGVLENGSRAARLIKAVNTALMVKRLSQEDGKWTPLSESDLRAAARQAGVQASKQDINVLETYGLIEPIWKSQWSDSGEWNVGHNSVGYDTFYRNTEFGKEVLKRLKEGEEEIFIPL